MQFRFNPKILDQYRWGWHLLFWCTYIAIYTFIHGSEGNQYFRELNEVLIKLPVKLAAVYVMLYGIMPGLLFRDRLVLFGIASFLLLLLASISEWLVAYHFVLPLHDHVHTEPLFSLTGISKEFVAITGIVGFASVIKLLKSWYRHKQASQELEKEKLEAELKFLKTQINPHLLFNTLNSLYSLTLEKSDDAPEVVLKLSDLLDYVLYECNEKTVSLEKEIDILRTYIALEEIRYGSRVTVNFTINGPYKGKNIAPLLLFPLVENSFKHGVSEQVADATVDISLDIAEEQLHFRVVNSTDKDSPFLETGIQRGIGINNLTRRLELIYGDQYELEFIDQDGAFMANLYVKLDTPNMESSL